MNDIWLRPQHWICSVLLLVGVIVLGFAYVDGRTLTLFIACVAMLIASILRWRIGPKHHKDESINSFFDAAHFLSPEMITERVDVKLSTMVRRTSLLRRIDIAAILLLGIGTVCLAIHLIFGTKQVPTSLFAIVTIVVVARFLVRMLWAIRLLQRSRWGNVDASVDAIDTSAGARESQEIDSLVDHIVDQINEGDVENAIKNADVLVAMRSELSGSYTMRGLAYCGARRWEEAIVDFSQAIEIDGKSAEAFRRRGEVRMKLGEMEHARNDLSVAFTLSPDADVFVAMGTLYFQTGEFALAVDAYEKAIVLENCFEASIGLAESFLELNRIRDSIDVCDTLISDFQSDTAYALRGWCKMLDRDFDGSLADLETATQLCPSMGGTYAHYGIAWLRSTCPIDAMRNSDLAKISAEKIASLKTLQQWEIEKLWAAVFANSGQWELSIEHQRKAIEEAPKWAKHSMEARLDKFRLNEAIRDVRENAGRLLPIFEYMTEGGQLWRSGGFHY